MEAELKPCPFCGGDAEEVQHEGGCFWYALCNDCGAEGPPSNQHRAGALWNRRVTAGVGADVCPHCKAEVGVQHDCPVAGPVWTRQELEAARLRGKRLARELNIDATPGVPGTQEGQP